MIFQKFICFFLFVIDGYFLVAVMTKNKKVFSTFGFSFSFRFESSAFRASNLFLGDFISQNYDLKDKQQDLPSTKLFLFLWRLGRHKFDM